LEFFLGPQKQILLRVGDTTFVDGAERYVDRTGKDSRLSTGRSMQWRDTDVGTHAETVDTDPVRGQRVRGETEPGGEGLAAQR
jgi:hypothetical protein